MTTPTTQARVTDTVDPVVRHPWASTRVIGKKEQAARREFARRQRRGHAASPERHKYDVQSNSTLDRQARTNTTNGGG